MLVVLSASAQVRFSRSSTDVVRERAIRENRLVFINLYATWCSPCTIMDREVFAEKRVGDLMNQYFVSAKYDIEQPTGRELMKRYGTQSTPIFLIFDTKGELLGRIVGGSSAEEFMENITTILGAI